METVHQQRSFDSRLGHLSIRMSIHRIPELLRAHLLYVTFPDHVPASASWCFRTPMSSLASQMRCSCSLWRLFHYSVKHVSLFLYLCCICIFVAQLHQSPRIREPIHSSVIFVCRDLNSLSASERLFDTGYMGSRTPTLYRNTLDVQCFNST